MAPWDPPLDPPLNHSYSLQALDTAATTVTVTIYHVILQISRAAKWREIDDLLEE